MKSVMANHQFSQIPDVKVQRSSFNRSHGHKTTFDAGKLIPIFVDEALPGDTFNLKMTAFARMSTPLRPIMDNLKLDMFFFSVPIRLLWQNFQRFMGEQINPGDSVDFLVPTMTSPATTGYVYGDLSDYFGIPTKVPLLEHSALWHRGYNLIWNTWFRDQNLQDCVVVDTDDSDSDPTDYVVLPRGKRHDYFTSCLPWSQKLNDLYPNGVALPIGGLAPVVGIGKLNTTWGGTATVQETNADGVVYAGAQSASSDTADHLFYFEQNTVHTGRPAIYADLSAATAATINAFREAIQIQRMLERDARGGTRYIELIRSHFGVTSPDARLQRPEYLGGGTVNINVTPIPQTSVTAATPQGNLAAMATASGQVGFVHSFVEHCVVIGLACARADLTYQHGLDRMFSRQTRFDYFWPTLAHLGEQSVLKKEIFATGVTNDDDDVFGYQERYAEYRYKPSKITGKFRSNATGHLDMWHLSQDFASCPDLDHTFIEENVPMGRILAVPSEPAFIFDSYFDFNCVRPMPVYSVPGMVDHF